MRLFLFIVALQFLFYLIAPMNWDVGRATLLTMAFAGAGFTLYLAWKRRLEVQHYFLFLPIAYMVLRSLIGGIPGYTDFLIAELVGVLGLAVWASTVDVKWVFRALVAAAAAQIIITVFKLVPWQNAYWETYSWGVMRHQTRFALLMFAGLMSAIWMIRKDSRLLKWLVVPMIPISLYAIYIVGSHTVMAMTLAAITILACMKWGRKVLFVCAILSALAIIHVGKDKFTVDPWRQGAYKTVAKESTKSVPLFLFGHGVGAWQLNCGAIGYKNCGHPHSWPLLVLYEQGAVGALIWFCVIALAVFFCYGEPMISLILLFVTFSTFTNSLFQYYDVEMIWALLLGAAYGRARE